MADTSYSRSEVVEMINTLRTSLMNEIHNAITQVNPGQSIPNVENNSLVLQIESVEDD